jgi:hypothetical protein
MSTKNQALSPEATTILQLYASNETGSDITVYPATANGNVAPSVILGGPSTGISNPQTVTLDGLGRLYVVNAGSNVSITIYPTNAKGGTSPLATIAGPRTLLDFPVGSAVDAAGHILVTNLSSRSTTFDSLLIFNAGANGDQAPAAMISGGGSSVIPGVYINNTCTSGCEVVCPPGS